MRAKRRQPRVRVGARRRGRNYGPQPHFMNAAWSRATVRFDGGTRCHISELWSPVTGTTCTLGFLLTRRMRVYLRMRPKAPSATPTLMKHHLVMMGPECGSYCSCQAACCVVPIVTIPTPGI